MATAVDQFGLHALFWGKKLKKLAECWRGADRTTKKHQQQRTTPALSWKVVEEETPGQETHQVPLRPTRSGTWRLNSTSSSTSLLRSAPHLSILVQLCGYFKSDAWIFYLLALLWLLDDFLIWSICLVCMITITYSMDRIMHSLHLCSLLDPFWYKVHQERTGCLCLWVRLCSGRWWF